MWAVSSPSLNSCSTEARFSLTSVADTVNFVGVVLRSGAAATAIFRPYFAEGQNLQLLLPYQLIGEITLILFLDHVGGQKRIQQCILQVAEAGDPCRNAIDRSVETGRITDVYLIKAQST